MKFAALLGYGLLISLIILGLYFGISRLIDAAAAEKALSSKKDD